MVWTFELQVPCHVRMEGLNAANMCDTERVGLLLERITFVFSGWPGLTEGKARNPRSNRAFAKPQTRPPLILFPENPSVMRFSRR